MKIQVNRNSCHGRVTRYVYGDEHIKNISSFCPYFWSIWLACILSPFIFITRFLEDHGQLTRVGLGLGLILLSLGIIYEPEITIIFSLAVIGVTTFGILLFWVIDAWEPEYKDNDTDDYVESDEKQPGVIATFLKSKKDKVCPMMEEVNN